MAVNFCGFKNPGATLEPQSIKFWTEFTNINGRHINTNKNIFEQYPSKDGFFRVEISEKDTPIQDSFIKINDQKIKFNDLTEPQTKDILQIKTIFEDFISPKSYVETEPEYLYSTLALENMGLETDVFRSLSVKRTLNDMNFEAHSQEVTAPFAYKIINILKDKLTETFM